MGFLQVFEKKGYLFQSCFVFDDFETSWRKGLLTFILFGFVSCEFYVLRVKKKRKSLFFFLHGTLLFLILKIKV